MNFIIANVIYKAKKMAHNYLLINLLKIIFLKACYEINNVLF